MGLAPLTVKDIYRCQFEVIIEFNILTLQLVYKEKCLYVNNNSMKESVCNFL